MRKFLCIFECFLITLFACLDISKKFQLSWKPLATTITSSVSKQDGGGTRNNIVPNVKEIPLWVWDNIP